MAGTTVIESRSSVRGLSLQRLTLSLQVFWHSKRSAS